MAIDERTRHELFLKLEDVLGPEEATTLMEHLPPVGWADVATKRDLDQLEIRMENRFETLEHKLTAAYRAEMISQTRTMIFTTMSTLVSVAGLAFAAARLV